MTFASVVFHAYTLTRCDPGVTTHVSDYELNGRYCAAKHGPDFFPWAEKTLTAQMDALYGVKR